MLADIRDILVIVEEGEKANFEKLFSDIFIEGDYLGVNFSYLEIPRREGIVKGLAAAYEFVGNNPCAFILGDNIFFGEGLQEELIKAKEASQQGFTNIFIYKNHDPYKSFPAEIKGFKAVTGLFFFPKGVCKLAQKIPIEEKTMALRDFLEKDSQAFTKLLEIYKEKDKIKRTILNYSYMFFDIDDYDALLDAANYIKLVQNNKQDVICCPEALAIKNGWVSVWDAEFLSRRINHAYAGNIFQKMSIKSDEINGVDDEDEDDDE